MRLTREAVRQLLDQNEGFETSTHYNGSNFTEDRHYRITGGELRIRSAGKTSWADSRFNEEVMADEEQTRRFLRNNLGVLNTNGLE